MDIMALQEQEDPPQADWKKITSAESMRMMRKIFIDWLSSAGKTIYGASFCTEQYWNVQRGADSRDFHTVIGY